MAVATVEQWIKEKVSKLPAYDTKDKAVEAAVLQEKKDKICEIWQEPGGGKFVVANPDAYEALYRAGYKKILDDIELHDIARKRKPVKKAMTYAQARKTE